MGVSLFQQTNSQTTPRNVSPPQCLAVFSDCSNMPFRLQDVPQSAYTSRNLHVDVLTSPGLQSMYRVSFAEKDGKKIASDTTTFHSNTHIEVKIVTMLRLALARLLCLLVSVLDIEVFSSPLKTSPRLWRSLITHVSSPTSRGSLRS